MINKLLSFGEKIYLKVKDTWETEMMHRFISNFLVFVFCYHLDCFFWYTIISSLKNGFFSGFPIRFSVLNYRLLCCC